MIEEGNSILKKKLQDKIDKVYSERILGASQVAGECAAIYEFFSEQTEAKSPTEFWDALYELSQKLVCAQPDMAPIFYLANQVLDAVRDEMLEGHSIEKLKKVVIEVVQETISRSKSDREKIDLLGISLIEENETILTHSHSSSVRDLLIATHQSGKSFEVIVTESRPSFEGRLLAQELGRQGIVTTLVIEAAALGMLDRCQKVFVGADRVSEKQFVNKVGTQAIALGAREKGIDFYVVCNTTKFVPGRVGSFVPKQHPPEEILNQRFPNVIVENPYFESIPLSLVTVLVCEKGLLPPAGVREYLQETVHFPELFNLKNAVEHGKSPQSLDP